MGSPVIKFYPRGATGPETITLPRITNIIPRPGRVIRKSSPVAGTSKYADLGAVREVEIIVEKIPTSSNGALIRKLLALDSHLRSGGSIVVCLDEDKLVGYPVNYATYADTTVHFSNATNLFAAFNSSAALSSGDEITIEDANPDHRMDYTTWTSLTGLRATIGAATTYSFGTALLRYRDLYFLRMSEEEASRGQWLTHNQRLNYTVSLRLEEHIGELMALVDNAGQLADDTTTTTEQGGLGLDDVMGNRDTVNAPVGDLEWVGGQVDRSVDDVWNW
jgi:hypothetical protein